jgi:hypothetical protein
MKICQSCGMPLEMDPGKGGTHADRTKSDTYCSYCYQNGSFTDEGITLEDKIEKNVRIAMEKMGIQETQAREMARSILPELERWKK